MALQSTESREMEKHRPPIPPPAVADVYQGAVEFRSTACRFPGNSEGKFSMFRPRLAVCLASLALAAFLRSARGADTLDYAVVDPELTLERLDTSPNESFLSMRSDSAGRLFVGGREALFVYEPAGAGRFAPRRELLRFPPDSWVYDIETRGHDLYVLTLSALYVIPDGVVRREGLEPKRLLWGVPRYHVHQCFHALAWGPQGDLYISMGDTLVHYGDFDRPDHWGHWTFSTPKSPNGVPYTGQGAVLRMHPDGSGLQVVASGFRNPCGLVFDRDWNLFSNDNDHESLPHAYVPGRLIHVSPHGDFGWPRGWMPHITPDRADLLETMFNGMGRAVPVGEAYLDSPSLPARLRHNLLVARWGVRAVMRYPITSRGASFQAEEQPLLVGKNQARPVGVTVAPDGAIFIAIAYMAHNDGSPIYASDLVRLTSRMPQSPASTATFEITARSTSALYGDLSSPAWEIRRRAHLELLRRGGDALNQAADGLAQAKTDDLAYPNLIWLAAACGSKIARDQLVRLSGDPESSVRFQAVRALHEFFANDDQATTTFAARLDDTNPQVALAATIAYFDAAPVHFESIAKVARCRDTYLRQAAARVLAERASFEFLKKCCSSTDEPTRLAGVLAAGFRLTLPAAMRPIAAPLPLAPWQSADIYQVKYLDETVDLRKLGRLGMFTVAEHWNAQKHSDEQESLFALLHDRLSDSSEQVRLQSAHFLFLLNDRRTEPEISALRKQTERRQLVNAPLKQLGRAWAVGPFADDARGLATVHEPEHGPIDLSAKYQSQTRALAWQPMKNDRMFDFIKMFGASSDASFYAYCRIESPVRQQMMLLPGSDDGLKIWHNGQVVWTQAGVRAALPLQDLVYLDLQPGSNDLLFRVNNVEGDCALYVHYRTLRPVSATLPERIGNGSLAERLKSGRAGSVTIGPEFLSVDWPDAARKGNPERGRKLFSVDGIGCAKCHAIDGTSAAVGGPSLAGAARRFTVPYLVESVLAPSRTVSPVFRATSFVLRDGTVLTGLVLGETSQKIDLLLPDATRRTVAASDVEQRKIQNTSPMPAGLVKTPNELSDLLAFLLLSTK
jgi:putative heme-binding domain-containing protein